jgi:hypothetical protein
VPYAWQSVAARCAKPEVGRTLSAYMRDSQAFHRKANTLSFPRLTSIALFAAVLAACSSPTQSLPSGGALTNSAGKAGGSFDSWHRALTQNRLPSAGCFEATYPSIAWTRIACSTPPRIWFPVPPSRRQIRPQNVGDGLDFTADTSPKLISTAIGAFPNVKGVTSVQSEGCCGIQGLNSYSLQLNSYFFTTSACGNIPNCAGWEQFVYSNPPSSDGELFIQDWLVATEGSLSGCPPSEGWEYVGIGCVQNSPYGVTIPNVSITDLGKVIETGAAASSGDSIYLSVGKKEYGMQNVQGDGITDLSQHWEGAEFNVIGNAGGDIADFNSGSKITVSLQTDIGAKKKPTCPADSGTTGESNNLSFVAAPKKPAKLQYPSIEFSMSSKTGGTASCDTVKGT